MIIGASLGARAHEHGEQWALANEYPATSLPGEGDAHFAKVVADKTRGRISIVTMPDAKLIFGFSALPFVVADYAQARALYEAARPAYEAAFAKPNQKLLYSTPWPASGLWTKVPATTPDAVAKLRIRAYADDHR